MQHTEPPAVERSLAMYIWLLRAYPPAFREKYRTEMALAFRDTARAAWRQTGFAGLIALWARTVMDTLVNATRERTGLGQFDIIWARAFALSVDRLIVLVALGILCSYLAPIARVFNSFHLPVAGWTWGDGHLVPKMSLVFVYGLPSIPWAAGIALWVIGSVAMFSATPAMRWIGLRVTTFDGSPLRWTRVLLWHFASFISGFAFGLGYLWALVNSEGRTWHDIIAGVRVSMPTREVEPLNRVG